MANTEQALKKAREALERLAGTARGTRTNADVESNVGIIEAALLSTPAQQTETSQRIPNTLLDSHLNYTASHLPKTQQTEAPVDVPSSGTRCRNKLIESGAQAIPKSCPRCGLNKYCADTALPQLAASPAPVEQDEPELQLLKQKAFALDEWFEKTDWVQSQLSTFPFRCLGLHRADIMRKEIERLRAITNEKVR